MRSRNRYGRRRHGLLAESLESRRLLTRAIDVDRDGDVDAYYQGTWFENVDGRGNLVAHQFTDRKGVSSEAADLDGDGDLDFITNEPAWYENLDGRGKSFAVHSFDGDPLPATRMKLFDVGGDGDLDVILFQGSDVVWYEQTPGAERFTHHTLDLNGVAGTLSDVTDADLDGDLDLLTFVAGTPDDQSNKVVLLTTEEDGSYRSTILAQDDPFWGQHFLGDGEFIDIDGDGFDDIVRKEFYDGIFYLLMRNGAESQLKFETPQYMVGVSGFFEVGYLLGFVDVDGDGDLDAVGESSFQPIVYVATLNAGKYTAFTAVATLDYPTTQNYSFDAVADLNGDGNLDVIAHEFNDELPVWFDGATGLVHINKLPAALQPGDANLDSYVDEADLILVAQAGKYQTAAGWSEGDWDGAPGGFFESPPTGDGLFNDSDLQQLLATGLYRAGSYTDVGLNRATGLTALGRRIHDTDVTFDYDSATGIVTLASSTPLTALLIRSASGMWTGQQTMPLDGPFDVASPSEIFRFDLAGFEAGNLGAILPPGMGWRQLMNDVKIDGARAAGGELGTVRLTCSNCGLDVDSLTNAIDQQINSREYDWDLDGRTDANDLRYLVQNVFQSSIGDANLDGIFNSSDLVQVLAAGEYEDTVENNSTWDRGDWNGDREFNTADLVFAFAYGHFADIPIPPVTPTSGPVEFSLHEVSEFCKCYVAVDTVADLDGDGDDDLLLFSFIEENVTWAENLNGEGLFGAPRLIGELAGIAVITADVDGDGDVDVIGATPSVGTGQIVWYENLGGGQFVPQAHMISTSDGAVVLSMGDVDQDGDFDLLAASGVFQQTGRIVWFENVSPQGTFVRRDVLSTHPASYGVQWADMDHDGDLDVFAGHSDNEFEWFENVDGRGQFVARPSTPSFATAVYRLADIDGDGDLDVLASGPATTSIRWYRNEGENFTEFAVPFETNDTVFSGALGDLDGDGDPDIVLQSKPAVWIENTDGLGAFTEVHSINPNVEMLGSVPVDVDRDGDLDLLTGEDWFENVDGQGTFIFGETIAQRSVDPRRLQAVDLDGDADLDILGGQWYVNRYGDAEFEARPVERWTDSFAGLTTNVTTTYAVDLDADGDEDLLVHSQSELFWRENENGEGYFGPAQKIYTSETYNRVEVAVAVDMDGDGDLDVVASFESHVSWFENLNGLGQFRVSDERFLDSLGTATLQLADLDGDQLDDLILSQGWHRQLPSGGFGPLQDFQVASSDALVYAFDLDGDQDLDILWGRAGEIKWIENLDGNATWGVPVRLVGTEAFSLSSLSAGDLDGDGDLEILFSDWGGQVGWFDHLDGQVAFGAMNLLIDADRAYSVLATDVDLDGDVDVLVGNEGGILHFENLRGR
ncbi:MAG: VCBS repeat-containing protein [Planctomycetales bacterium]|nr:VCBS repeat-containing protein [Planctomycetales bacterium]